MTYAISVIVVAYHRPLAGLLERIAHPDIETIVVNVEQDPNVSAAVHRAGAIEVPLAGNPGFGAGVNRGVAASSASVVVFVNDDLDFSADDALALGSSLDELSSEIVVPRLVTEAGQVEPTIAALPSAWTLLIEWALTPDTRPSWGTRISLEKWRSPTSPERIWSAAATVVATRRHLLAENPLPEAYHLYWEEAEWFHTMRRIGAVVTFEPRISVQHRGGRGDVRPEKSRLLARNAIRCVRRTRGRPHALAAWPVVVLWNLRLWLTELFRRRYGQVEARRAGLHAALCSWREIL